MSEEESIGMVGQPGTRQSIGAVLRQLGVDKGMTLIVHSSLSRMGWVNGGPVAVIQALMDVLTEKGTLVMPAHSSDLSDPALWQNPPVPKEWQDTIRDTMPFFDPRRTPTRQMGRIAELFRTWPGVKRSAHPQMSFAAWGQDADFVTDNHALEYSLGDKSPLARVYDLDGSILLIGVDYDRNTSFHLAEYRVPNPPLVRSGTPWIEQGRRIWKAFDDVDFDDDLFPSIGQGLEKTSSVTIGNIGAAQCRLMSQRSAVDFAQEWLLKHKNR
jgi:aminoglycoside 3-N-acetyltransferase